METSSRRITFSIILTISLLAISLAVGVFVLSMTLREVNHFQQQHTLAVHKDVHAIRPWMTLTYISRFYHVPEPYLIQALRLKDTHNADRLPIQILAQHNSRSVTEVTNTLQAAIVTYHREHPATPTPTTHPRTHTYRASSPSTLRLKSTHAVLSKNHTQSVFHVPTTRPHGHVSVRSVEI